MALSRFARCSPGRRPLVLAVFMVPLLFGCGSDDGSSTAASATTTTESTTTTTATSTATTEATATTTATSTATTEATATTAATADTVVVEVFFGHGDGTDCSEVIGFEREVDAAIDPATAAFAELVAGPTAAEEAAGAHSFFSSATADVLRSVSLTEGVLTVDFDDIRTEISNASTSCGSAAFTSSLNATAFQFPAVETARYLFAGSCEDFGGFLQTDICEFPRNGS